MTKQDLFNGKPPPILPKIKGIPLPEDEGEFFEGKTTNPYMLVVNKIQERIKLKTPEGYLNFNYWDKLYTPRSKLQSITHVDFSARIQTVSKKTNLRYWNLINEFKKITNVGVLVNTSFNVRGEPIVNSPEDAFRCFMNTEMDVLVIEKFIYFKKNQTIKIKKNEFEKD